MLKQSLALIGLTLSLGANAALVDSINALNPGDQYRVLFVTSTATTATSSDISTYNTIANNAGTTGAITSGLGLTWKALASTPFVGACDNTSSCAPSGAPVFIFNTLGTLLADSYDDLWDGSLASPVDFNEHGELAVDFAWVWSGSQAGGVQENSYELGGSTGAAILGSPSLNYNWMTAAILDSTELLPLFSLSQATTVVPIPAAAWLFGSALLGLGVIKRRKL